MNQTKFEAKRRSLNSQLSKVFDAVPINEPWMATAISAEMRRIGSGGSDSRATLGCLNSLLEMGLVQEPTKGYFQKVQPKECTPPKEPRIVEAKHQITETKMQAKPTTLQMTTATVTPIEKLSKLAARLRDLANDMEVAALELAEQAEKNEVETAKMRQLQTLLKSLG